MRLDFKVFPEGLVVYYNHPENKLCTYTTSFRMLSSKVQLNNTLSHF